jgi:hypothetical protein
LLGWLRSGRNHETLKPFATLGSEISKVRERVRRSAENLRPAKVASDVRDQRDRLLAKLGEQTFRLIAERKLAVPKVLQESVEKLAALLGVQLPPLSSSPSPEGAQSQPTIASAIEGASADASHPLEEPAEVDEPAIGDEVTHAEPPKPAPKNARPKKRGGKRKKGR